MSDRCPECGVGLQPGGSCRDNFNALLALEWDIPGGAGTIAHFYAVSSYILQHPDSMFYTVESIAWLRSAVVSALAGEVSTEDLRRSAGQGGKKSGHVTRRSGDPIPEWEVERWSMTVADVLAGGVDGYGERVEEWAASVIADLSASEPDPQRNADNAGLAAISSARTVLVKRRRSGL